MEFTLLIEKFDKKITYGMDKICIPSLRLSFGVIFIWFGILKPLGLSSAENLLKSTVEWLSFGSPDSWLIIIGCWEVIIGLLFLSSKTTKIALILLYVQMLGTFMPLVFLPELTFQNNNYLLPTMEGQYIFKNLMIVSAGLVLGGNCNKHKG